MAVKRSSTRARPAVEPGVGAVVMATGIVSIALADDGETLLSHIWLGVAAALWVLLVIGIGIDPRAWMRAAARTPAGLTPVAATCVVGSGATSSGLHAVGGVLLGLGAAICVTMVVAMRGSDFAIPRSGSSFMLTVSLQSLAGLAALQASSAAAAWLAWAGLGGCVVALALYVVVALHFDLRELLRGNGDQWIVGGALAISALTMGALGRAFSRVGPHFLASPLADVAAVIWVLGLIWLPVLLATELVAPRLRYESRRWATLFPVGMYAASGFEVARISGLGFAGSFARGWTWVAVALWLVLAWLGARRLKLAR
jgi:tellurite resistance protein TehA-like permease